MSKLGRILVYVTVVFSLIVCALIILNFITTTPWQKGHEIRSRELIAERTRHIADVTESNAVISKKSDELQQAELTLAKTSKEVEQLKADVAKALNDKVVEADLRNKAKIQAKALITERDNLHVELKRKDELIVARDKEIVKMVADSNKDRQERIKYEIEAKSTRARNEQLTTAIEKMQKEFEDLRRDKLSKSGLADVNPPPEDVKGTVKQTDASGLIVINLGSDSGLTKGNTLEVYRTAPKPMYLGRLRIQDVRPNEAVGKLVAGARPGAIQVGDAVASKILDNR